MKGTRRQGNSPSSARSRSVKNVAVPGSKIPRQVLTFFKGLLKDCFSACAVLWRAFVVLFHVCIILRFRYLVFLLSYICVVSCFWNDADLWKELY